MANCININIPYLELYNQTVKGYPVNSKQYEEEWAAAAAYALCNPMEMHRRAIAKKNKALHDKYCKPFEKVFKCKFEIMPDEGKDMLYLRRKRFGYIGKLKINVQHHPLDDIIK